VIGSGSTIFYYNVTEKIGKGGMCVADRAEDARLIVPTGKTPREGSRRELVRPGRLCNCQVSPLD
jgi:hypothetical protein